MAGPCHPSWIRENRSAEFVRERSTAPPSVTAVPRRSSDVRATHRVLSSTTPLRQSRIDPACAQQANTPRQHEQQCEPRPTRRACQRGRPVKIRPAGIGNGVVGVPVGDFAALGQAEVGKAGTVLGDAGQRAVGKSGALRRIQCHEARAPACNVYARCTQRNAGTYRCIYR